MPAANVTDALSSLAAACGSDPALEAMVRPRWETGAPFAAEVPQALRAAVDHLAGALPALTRQKEGRAALGALLGQPAGVALVSWMGASAWRRDAVLAPLLAHAAGAPDLAERAIAAARARVVSGPLGDAFACVPLLGDGDELARPENVEARARIEILLWEAGARALQVPAFGAWLWASPATFQELVRRPAHGALRGRVLAARCLEVTVGSMPPESDLVGPTLQVLQPLLLHPEPLVWVHAARALGRLTGPVDRLEGMLLDWILGDSRVLRQRALTAFASLPAERMRFLAGQLITIIASPEEDAAVLGAVAAATPYLFFERRDIWNRLARRVLAGDGGAIAARALARGLATLWRRGLREPEVETPLRALREMARRVQPDSFDELRRWIEVTTATDALDGAERDPLDLELGLDNLMRVAAEYDEVEADARAARFAGSLAATFGEARRLALGLGRPRHRAAAVNALEGCARSLALRLWGPLLATCPNAEGIEEPDLGEVWKTLAGAPAQILDLVAERRRGGGDPLADLPLEVLALRLGGYALDACGEDADLGPGRGPTAHDTCLWLRKLEGLADGSRDLPPPLRGALSALFWRLVDTTRGTTLGEVDDVHWLGPFAAWWALVIDRPAMLLQLGTALPMMAAGKLEYCCAEAESLRRAVSSGAADGQWGPATTAALASLHAEDTELGEALTGLAGALATFGVATGGRPDLEPLCLQLVLAADRLQGALADPVKALHPASAATAEDSLGRRATENAPRVAALVTRAIRARDMTLLDVWLASLGPVASALLEAAVRAAIRRTPPPPPKPRKPEPTVIAGYELVRRLGEGGVGSVWLVRKPGADRLFVLKIPKRDALSSANDVERAGILTSFVEEAAALAGLYHPNVANIIDRGVQDGVPFLVLEYLIGADLRQYAAARLLTLPELRPVVLQTCAGLAALHGAGLVHRDIKPANLWLRLPLRGDELFDPARHRDPGAVPVLATVVIDFGMVRAARVPPETCGRFVAGTAGYIAPEQVLDPSELDPRADVYALAASIYNVTTGRALFDEIANPRDRIVAHMRSDPFDDPERLRPFPAAVASLLRAATARTPGDRPMPLEFGRAFAAAL